eukprot:681657-Pelagomonas_calceolata.AAC.8
MVRCDCSPNGASAMGAFNSLLGCVTLLVLHRPIAPKGSQTELIHAMERILLAINFTPVSLMFMANNEIYLCLHAHTYLVVNWFNQG